MSDVIALTRQQIARFVGNDPVSVRALEALFQRVMSEQPDESETVGLSADVAIGASQAAATAATVAQASAEEAIAAAQIAHSAARVTAEGNDYPIAQHPATAAVWDAIQQLADAVHIARSGAYQHFYEFQRVGADPTTNDIPDGQYGLFKNTASGLLQLWANDGGVMRSVTLT